MNPEARRIQWIYLTLTLFSTLSASLIWGINTLFLLDAGLSNTEAFTANAFFTAGMVLFEIPTGVVADLRGRRLSYLLGTTTLAASTAFYLLSWQIQAPFWTWVLSSLLLGLGFTFFSGATQAWLVDALAADHYQGVVDNVFARGQIVQGIAMLGGSVLGGVVAQSTNLGVPYMIRVGLLVVTFAVAAAAMHDVGFTPKPGGRSFAQMRTIIRDSVDYGLRIRPVRWIMLSGPFLGGVMAYAFYAMQPYLLELYGDPNAYGVAGLAAAIVAGAQILGGLLVPQIRRVFHERTTILLVAAAVSIGSLFVAGALNNFWATVVVLALWATSMSAAMPVRQAYINALIPSTQRATVLSFDSMVTSTGGVVAQPALGKAADLWSYGTSLVIGSIVQIGAVPFLLLARREHSPSDEIRNAVNDEPDDEPERA